MVIYLTLQWLQKCHFLLHEIDQSYNTLKDLFEKEPHLDLRYGPRNQNHELWLIGRAVSTIVALVFGLAFLYLLLTFYKFIYICCETYVLVD